MPLYRAVISATYCSQLMQNVVHFTDKTNQGGVPVDCRTIAQDMVANWLPQEINLHEDTYQWTDVLVTEIRNPAPMPAHREPTLLKGAGVTKSHSVSCFKLKWITARGGRRGFGKMYIGGINWALISGENLLSQTARDRLLAYCAALESRYMSFDGGPVPYQMVLVHKDANDPPTPITSCDFYPLLGVQRRRNRGVGV